MPLFIIAQFHAKPGCEQALIATLRTVVEPTRDEPGCIEIHVFQALRDGATFFIQSKWAAEADFELHAELPHTQRFLNQVPNLIDNEFRAVRCVPIA